MHRKQSFKCRLFKLFSPDGKTLHSCVPHPADTTRPLVRMFDFVHILKSIRNNWINLKNINQTFIYPDLSSINLSHIAYPLRIHAASFDDIRQQYLSEKYKLAKLALTAKSCWLTSLERQNVKLALKIFDESTLAAISLRNEANHNSQTEDFINIILKLWKIFLFLSNRSNRTPFWIVQDVIRCELPHFIVPNSRIRTSFKSLRHP